MEGSPHLRARTHADEGKSGIALLLEGRLYTLQLTPRQI